jgi:hypothetical protein
MKRGIFLGTDGGVHLLGGDGARELDGRPIGALAPDDDSLWAIADEALILHSGDAEGWEGVAALEGGGARCLLPTGVGVLVGASEARLFKLSDGALEQIDSFREVEGRDVWYTPWGGPPSVRSLAESDDGTIYVNVHVGGIPKSGDGARSWQPTIEVDSDVHQVIVEPSRRGRVLAATARGLATSEDGGGTWSFHTGGLNGIYCRAVAVSAETVFLTASDGPFGGHAALYQRSLDSDGPLERCEVGLPDWFPENIDTHCLDAIPGLAAFGVQSGSVFASEDEGETWREEASGLPPVRSVLVR